MKILFITFISLIGITQSSKVIFVISIVLIAFAYGGATGTFPVLVSDYFGVKYLGENYSAAIIIHSVLSLIFPIIIRLVNSSLSNIICLFLFSLISICMVFLLKKSVKTTNQKLRNCESIIKPESIKREVL